jgi:hypothetical protein
VAYGHLGRLRQIAERLGGGGRNDYNAEFQPVNTDLSDPNPRVTARS